MRTIRKGLFVSATFVAMAVAEVTGLLSQSPSPGSQSVSTSAVPSTFPIAEVKLGTEEYFGTKVADPYR
jgi:hypothetical protein